MSEQRIYYADFSQSDHPTSNCIYRSIVFGCYIILPASYISSDLPLDTVPSIAMYILVGHSVQPSSWDYIRPKPRRLVGCTVLLDLLPKQQMVNIECISDFEDIPILHILQQKL